MRSIRGFTLIELLVVITIIGIFSIAALPNMLAGYRNIVFSNTVKDVVTLVQKARTQALASELDANAKISPGGYGVWLGRDGANNLHAVLFINDWNAAAGGGTGAVVNMDYADTNIANRVAPDTSYTPGFDTLVEDVLINKNPYIELTSLKGLIPGTLDTPANWSAEQNRIAVGATGMSIIFQPPYADTIIEGAGTDYQLFEGVFTLRSTGATRTLRIDRITTTPQITK